MLTTSYNRIVIAYYLINLPRAMFPTVEPVVSVEESCIYTLSPDWNPILDTLPAARNIVIGVGFSGIMAFFLIFKQYNSLTAIYFSGP